MSAGAAVRSAIALLALAGATALDAQVGHTPQSSPYRDLEHSHELTGFAGYMSSPKDPAGVAYRGGPMLGARYEYRLGGPAYVVGRVGAIQSERTVIDPSEPVETRIVGDRTSTILFSDIGLALSLTGHKSWHGLVPVVQGGVGILADFRNSDVGGFRFGTPFALPFGAGVRWVPGGRLQVRLDFTDYLFRISYPERYYRSTETVPAVLENSVPRSRWTHNGALTIGLSYLFGR
jgi:hypothetical protein